MVMLFSDLAGTSSSKDDRRRTTCPHPMCQQPYPPAAYVSDGSDNAQYIMDARHRARDDARDDAREDGVAAQVDLAEDHSSEDHSSEDHSSEDHQMEEEEAMGCSHYARRAMLVCAECDTPYWCRHCHDAELDNEPDVKRRHQLDRSRVTDIVCGKCNTRQPVGAFCTNASCGITFGEYTCTRCPFYDDRVEREYFHCSECGICRVGGRDNFFHCPTCDGCFSKSMEQNHTCVERNLKQNCPVCFEYQFDSIHPNTVLSCGHTIHVHCLQELEEKSAGIVPCCPICKRSIGDYQNYWRLLDSEIERTPVPEEYQGWRADIVCNDCSQATTGIPFHLIGLKCGHCGSYNTQRQSVIMRNGEEVEE